ncbi:MAG: hypothetical protein JW769_04890 [Parachlamydiales bacterium]|nr:hypothetical protein [Parachlamydiales bacterium]
MDAHKNFKELIKWGSENDKNRQKAIRGALFVINVMNETRGKKLSDSELDKIAGGIAGCYDLDKPLGLYD